MGLELLFQGSNIERLLNGLWVTAEIAFVSVFFACILGVIFGVIMTNRKSHYQSHLPLLFRICAHHSIISVTFSRVFRFSKMV